MDNNKEKQEEKLFITLPKSDDEFKIDRISNLYSSNLQGLMNSLQPLIKQMVSNADYIQEMVINPMQELMKKLSEMIRPLIDTITSQIPKYTPYFKELAEAIEKAQKNPDSLINWYKYSEKLSEYLWTIPFDIDSKKLKDIFEQINSEKEFDNYMTKYFTKEKINNLFMSIENILPTKHKTMFKQIKKAFNDKLYSLSIVGIMAIIDELCSYFLIDKGCNGRQNLFEPIIKDLDKEGADNFTILDLMILSDNLNVIYESIEFNEKIKINTHKKARRNPSQHGRSFSNRKVDVIMLLNTMFNLLVAQKELKKYKNKIYKKKKDFYIPKDNERKQIKRKIKENIDEKKELIKQ